MADLRVAAAILLALLVALPLAGCTRKGNDDKKAEITCVTGVPRRDIDERYGFCAPQGWAEFVHVDGFEVRLTSPAGVNDTFLESINVMREVVNENATLWEVYLVEVANLQASMANFTLVGQVNRTLGGEPAIALEYRGRAFGHIVNVVQVVAIHERVAFRVVYLAQQGHQFTFQAAAELVWDTFTYL